MSNYIKAGKKVLYVLLLNPHLFHRLNMASFKAIFSLILLIATYSFVTLIDQTIAASTNPSQASQALHKEADKHAALAEYNRLASGYDGIKSWRPLRKEWANEHHNKAIEVRKKAQKVENLGRQLETNTVAGNASPPRGRTRSQSKQVAAP
ncbi:uncharacterized protein FA14DRAFT_63932 [Meira miltonrushii]|uniref:Uncharacterized protein n=1 Tax=Meira miltonrushii TaxID=1280837 RepID=A0A316V7Z2_9BASI|nr:uncharacterized protein FA14DRAFT_63932 [Meira miltonrushii]PWN33620.1 hypothetical protein FA14DRAFT_63932 [Meira miltonrushii]